MQKIDKSLLERFLFEARTKTYAGGGGKVKSIIDGLTQLEYSNGDWSYRDLYYNGKNGFSGMDGVYYKGKPVWACSYFGCYKGILEEEVDRILRQALIDNPQTRGYKPVEWKKDNYRYVLEPDFVEGIENAAGVEHIYRGANEIYTFYYGGQVLV